MARQYTARYGRKGMDIISEERKREISNISSIGREKTSLTVDISLNSILLVLGVLFGLYLGAKLLHVIALVFFAFIISSASLPFVRWFREKGLSQGVSIFLTYFFGIIFLLITLLLIFIPSFSESQKLIQNLPEFSENITESLERVSIGSYSLGTDDVIKSIDNMTDDLTDSLKDVSGEGFRSAINTVVGIAGGFLSLLLVILMSVYIIADHDNFVDLLLLRIVDEKRRRRVRQLVLDVESKLGNWLLGQATLSFIIGVIVWIFLTIVGLPFALPLAVFAGLLESIPNLGPTIAAAPAVLIALVVGGPVLALIVLIGYFVIQQLENTIIVPRIMSNAVGLRPIIVIIAVSSGFTLAGPIGALLAVPIAVLFQVAYEFHVDLQKLKAKGIV